MALSGQFSGSIELSQLASLSSLSGAENLVQIEVVLRIFSDLALVSLAALEQLQHIDGALSLTEVDGLESLDDLDYLESVGALGLTKNANLANVAGLSAVMDVAGDVIISGNPRLPHTAAEQLVGGILVGGSVTICGNLDGPPC
jgi:hypothetical protein